MFVKKILNYILGYVNIKVESYYIERFINICTSKKIFLWNIKREKSTILYANISIKEYKLLKDIARKVSMKISIEKKKGLPILLHKYRKRKIFAGFLLFIAIVLITISQFIWNIEITGDENLNKTEILQELKNLGLNIGVLKSKINTTDIINQIRLKRNDIAWLGINIKGTNAIIEVVSREQKPNIIDENDYCNIVAEKSGMITTINVQNGTALVKEGDIVEKGTILVGGYLEGKYTGTRYVHSLADIQAKIWYAKKEKFSYNQQLKKPSDTTETKYSIKINNFTINFYKTLSKFKNYDTIMESKKLNVFSNFYLPIEIIKTTNSEFYYEDVTYTEKELLEIAKTKLENELLEEIENKDDIINEQVNVYKIDDGIEVEVIYEVLEEIGTEEKIVF